MCATLDAGAQGSDFGIYPVGSWPGYLRGPSSLVIAKDDYAFMVLGGVDNTAIGVIDVRSSTGPRLVTSLSIDEHASDVLALGLVENCLYVFGRSAGLVIIDVSSPEKPRLSRSLKSLSAAAFVRQGRYGYFAASGLRIADLQDPASPQPVSELIGFGTSMDVAISGNLAVVASMTGGAAVLQFVDVSNPASPRTLSYYSSVDPGRPVPKPEVEIIGSNAFLYHPRVGIKMLNVADPSVPVFMGSVDLPYVYEMEAANGHLFVSDGAKLRVFRPQVTNVVEVSASQISSVVALSFENTNLYAADVRGLRIVSVANPSAPVELSFCLTDEKTGRIKVDGNHAYLAEFDYNARPRALKILDISDRSTPRLVAAPHDRQSTWDIAVTNGFAYVAEYTNGLVILDVSDPSRPLMKSRFTPRVRPVKVCVIDRFAYLLGAGDGNDLGFEIVNITDRERPVSLGYLALGAYSWVSDFLVAGGNAYVVWNGSCFIIDISVVTAPARVASFWGGGTARGITVMENWAYLMSDSGVTIWDVREPGNPVRISERLPIPSDRGCFLGDYLLVENGSLFSRLTVLDVRNRTNAVFVRYYSDFVETWDITARGNCAYVADGYGGMRIIEVSPPGAVLPARLEVQGFPVAAGLRVQSEPERTIIIQRAPVVRSGFGWESIATNFTSTGTLTVNIPVVTNQMFFFRALSY
jgi:hypothetical protein